MLALAIRMRAYICNSRLADVAGALRCDGKTQKYKVNACRLG